MNPIWNQISSSLPQNSKVLEFQIYSSYSPEKVHEIGLGCLFHTTKRQTLFFFSFDIKEPTLTNVSGM